MRLIRQQSRFEGRHNFLARDRGCPSTTLFQERFVSAPRRFGVTFADMVADRLDAHRESMHMTAALLRIGIQETIIGFTSQNCFQLPCQVADVADALAHTLADKRRLLVSGISCKENPPLTPLGRN